MSDIKYHYKMYQGTDEWLQARVGVVTASEVCKLFTAGLAPANNKTSRGYAMLKAAERITGRFEENIKSSDMMRGHIQEPIARDYYSDNYEQAIECGFITRDFGGFTIGASPDGLVGNNGGIEIKSRLPHYQIQIIIAGEVPDEYMLQIQTCLLVSGRDWWDFVQYSNAMELFVKRVYPDIELHEKIVNTVRDFEAVVSEMVDSYKEKAAVLVPTEYIELNKFDDILEIDVEED